MPTTTSHSRAARAATVLALAATTALLGGGTSAAAPSDSADPRGKPVTVMTRNVYLGADINRPVRAAVAATPTAEDPFAVVNALANATHTTRTIVDATDFRVRAELLADEIVETGPQLVGLQEVALWRSGPLQIGQVGVANATQVDYDFLQILLDELAERGETYVGVRIGLRADVEAPSYTGRIPASGSPAGIRNARDVRLTMRDVILMDADGGLKVTGSRDKIFAHNLAVPVAGQLMKFDRGYQWVDVRAGTESFRFVNSHFEAFSSDLAYAQAAQVLAEAVAGDRTTIFACDCNSDPLDDSIKEDQIPPDTREHREPYQLLTTTFTDQWLEWAPAEEGWTSGLSERVRDTSADGFDHRIDMIFARTVDGEPLEVDRGEVVGTTLSDRDPATGLWPSDHGGVVLRLRGL